MLVTGAVLHCMPFPICKEWGAKIAMSGLSACAGSVAPSYDAQKEKNKEKEKKK